MRTALITRKTLETHISLQLNLEGQGQHKIVTDVPFLNHMLQQFVVHSGFNLEIHAKGDTEIDDHHIVEDIGIVLGQALAQAIGDKTGITRYGCSYIPLDEALSRVVLDCSGRPGLAFRVSFARSRIGSFEVDLIREFFQALVNHAAITLHIDNLFGVNAHHQCETIFKAFARALRAAVAYDHQFMQSIPSTKGVL